MISKNWETLKISRNSKILQNSFFKKIFQEKIIWKHFFEKRCQRQIFKNELTKMFQLVSLRESRVDQFWGTTYFWIDLSSLNIILKRTYLPLKTTFLTLKNIFLWTWAREWNSYAWKRFSFFLREKSKDELEDFF